MKIQTVSVTRQVVDYMKENIESGNWAVGKKIPSENQMIEELGVSRSSIRSAVQYLAGLGILKSYQGKGTILIDCHVDNWDSSDSKITSEDCRDIYRVLEFRKMLEPQVCRLAVRNADEETIATLEKWLEQMKQFRGKSEKSRFVWADLKFHETICQCSGNPLAEKSLHKVFLETRRNHEQMNEIFGYESGIRFHTALIDAFKARDAQAAYETMELHIQEAMDVLQSMIQ